MATLEDKLLGEKTEYYCSSSSEGEEDEEESENKDAGAVASSDEIAKADVSKWSGTASNTGPKGVLSDWQKFKELEKQKIEEEKMERVELIKKLSITCQSALDEEREKAEAEKDPELKELFSDKFLQEYMQKRMNEMLQQSSNVPKFGKVINLTTGQEFLDAVDKELKSVTIIVHIYEEKVAGCEAMNGSLIHLSQKYSEVKFCKMKGSLAGLSNRFKVSGVPALLVYKSGQLVGNFVRLTDEFGEDFFACDVESFLIEHGMIPDKTCVPQISQLPQDDDDDSDLSLE
ncbi:phosducin-like protein [Ischnura elegans]|uniref:phosducin-like protein n=1 Tax=Ischnura elegans TaxID=197161 RepID=UPI001ED8BF9B|nr:phosducin-like protein [Ischnura elegans]